MGTTYSIRIAAPLSPRKQQRLQAQIDAALDEVNRQMSTYRPDSEISRFNLSPPNQPLPISPGFLHVLRRALEIAHATGGAFDPTVGALVNLWGFGPDGLRRAPPSPAQIDAARQTVGYRHVSIAPDGRISKTLPGLRLDLGAIAKGYGVDQVAALLRAQNLNDFIVEIGGETLAEGLNPDGIPWRVGILQPTLDADNAAPLHAILRLFPPCAVATSGDYRNYFLDPSSGQIQSHIIDPRTAAPAQHAVASVTVLAPDCLAADALATALLVLGPDEGLPLLASAFPDVHALFLLRLAPDRFEEISSPGFPAAANRLSP